jgi:hypothetical protein
MPWVEYQCVLNVLNVEAFELSPKLASGIKEVKDDVATRENHHSYHKNPHPTCHAQGIEIGRRVRNLEKNENEEDGGGW